MFFGGGKIAKLDDKIEAQAQRNRADMDVLFHWVHYLNAQNEQTRRSFEHFSQAMQHEVHALTEELKGVRDQKLIGEKAPSTDDVKQMVDRHMQAIPVDTMLARLRHMESSIQFMDQKRQVVQPVAHPAPAPVPTSNLQHRLVKKITRHSKSYIKNSLVQYIQKYGKISALKLRDIVVDEQGLCSKSTFYRLLEELERDHNLEVIVDGKQKMFIAPNEVKHA